MTEQIGTEEKSSRKSKIIIIVLIVLLILSLLFGGILLGMLITGDDSFLTWLGITSGKTQWGGLRVDSGEYVAPVINQTSQPGVAIPGWGTIKIPADTKKVYNLPFYNPEANNGTYGLVFELLVPIGDNGSYVSIYKSDLIEPGEHVSNPMILNKSLSRNTQGYDAIIHVQPYRTDGSLTNNADMKTKLIVI